jgi:hypothetical protein
MLGLMRRLVLTTAVTMLAACPGDPTEASTVSVSGTGDTSAEGPTTLTVGDDDSVTMTDPSADDGSDTDPSDTMPDAMCGNGIVEPPEECDVGPDNTMGANCTFDCTNNECGDGYVGYMESCDPPGNGCAGNCIVSSCGDGDLDEGEDCDWVADPKCPMNCMLGCGDGRIDPGEECEGKNLNGNDCVTTGHVSGVLQCDAACQFVETGCSDCGNGVQQGTEECDGGVGPALCTDLGFLDGTLTCSASCLYDTTQCVNFLCGNGIIELPEQCDGNQLGGHTCASEGFAPTGGIDCTDSCALDTSACTLCGNGDLDDGEECDTDMIPVPMCTGLGDGWDQGDVTCASNCTYNVGDCCYDDVGDNCGVGSSDDSCCGALQCDNQTGLCCQPNGGDCNRNNNAACCSGNCDFGSDTCMGNDS